MAKYLSKQGIVPIPVRPKSKIPCESGWTEPKHGNSDLVARFGGPDLNIGVLLGKPSGDLVDIDIDCPEGIELAKSILPDTGWTHGRQSARTSHYFYFAPGSKTRKFVDPIDGTMLLEIRSDGCQTVVPPSRHESGELVEHEGEGVATEIRSELLQDDVSKLAAATIFVRHYPANGDRHNAIMAFSGMLLKGGLAQDVVEWFVTVIAKAAGDEEWEQRKTDVATTAERLAQRQPVTGAPTLARIIDERVVRSVAELLGIEWRGESRTPAAPSQPEPLRRGLEVVSLCDLLAEEPEETQWLVEGCLPAGGMSALIAKPKAGKSTIARHLALSVSRGEPFLGYDTHQGRVLYLALEEKRYEVQVHFLLMGADGSELLDTVFGPAPQNALQRLQEAAEDSRPALIIVDTLQLLTRVGDLNDYAEVNNTLEQLRQIPRTSGAHLMFAHHARKGRLSEDGALGSTAITGAVDITMFVSRNKESRSLWTVQRYGEDLEETIFELDPETRIPYLAGNRIEFERGKKEEHLLSVLQNAGQAISRPDLEDRATGKTAHIRAALNRLVARGAVIRTGRGVKGDVFMYGLPAEPKS